MQLSRRMRKRKREGQVGGGSAGSLITGKKRQNPSWEGVNNKVPVFFFPHTYVARSITQDSRRGAASAYC